MEKPRVLVCINELERNTFLPAPLWQKLNQLEAEVHTVASESLDQPAYIELLESLRPEVLVTAWSTPRLPTAPDAVCRVLSHLRLKAHLAGSLKGVPRIYLEKGLKVTNWGSSISRTVAECALMLILCCLRQTTRWQLEMHVEKSYSRPEEFLSLFERRVGLYGFGRVAQALTRLLQPFDVELFAYDPDMPEEFFTAHRVHRCNSPEELFGSVDVLVNVAPATPKYYHSVSEQLLRKLPVEGVFVNVGRGQTVDEEVLIKIAKEGSLRVGLDVFEAEPLATQSPLRGLKNVCLLPHIGGPTVDRRKDAGKRAVGLIAQWVKDGSVDGAVCLSEYERAT